MNTTNKNTAHDEWHDDAFHDLYNALRRHDDPDEDEDTADDEDEDDKGDWGHVDPYENNGPFPDPNEPTAPGSAV